MTEIAEELRRRADTMNGVRPVGAGDSHTYVTGCYSPGCRDLDRRAASELDRLKARNAELEAALEPFRQRCEEVVRPDDGDNDGVTVKTVYLRGARAILPLPAAPAKEEDNG